jgi:hypothetical protein
LSTIRLQETDVIIMSSVIINSMCKILDHGVVVICIASADRILHVQSLEVTQQMRCHYLCIEDLINAAVRSGPGQKSQRTSLQLLPAHPQFSRRRVKPPHPSTTACKTQSHTNPHPPLPCPKPVPMSTRLPLPQPLRQCFIDQPSPSETPRNARKRKATSQRRPKSRNTRKAGMTLR